MSLRSPALAGEFFTTSASGKPIWLLRFAKRTVFAQTNPSLSLQGGTWPGRTVFALNWAHVGTEIVGS